MGRFPSVGSLKHRRTYVALQARSPLGGLIRILTDQAVIPWTRRPSKGNRLRLRARPTSGPNESLAQGVPSLSCPTSAEFGSNPFTHHGYRGPTWRAYQLKPQQLHNTIVAAPDEVRDRIRNITRKRRLRTCSAWRPDTTGIPGSDGGDQTLAEVPPPATGVPPASVFRSPPRPGPASATSATQPGPCHGRLTTLRRAIRPPQEARPARHGAAPSTHGIGHRHPGARATRPAFPADVVGLTYPFRWAYQRGRVGFEPTV